MNRRQVLATIGGSAAMLSLAGCTGSDETGESSENGDGENAENDAEDSEESSAESVDTSARIASASSSLDKAVTEFDTTIDDDPIEEDATGEDSNGDGDDELPTVDTDRIETLIDDAEADIETARSGASDEQLETLESLETLAQFLRDLVPALSAINDAMTNFEEGDRHMDDEEYGAVVDVYEQSESNIGLANDEATVARATFDELESGAFESVDELDHGELTTTVDDLEAFLEATEVTVDGLAQMVEGMEPLQAGNEALNANQFQTAASEFEAASDTFYQAYTTVDDGVTDVSEDHREDLLEFACETEALSDGMDYYAQGAEAMAAGDDQRGWEYFAQGEEAINRCEGEYGDGDGDGAAMPPRR